MLPASSWGNSLVSVAPCRRRRARSWVVRQADLCLVPADGAASPTTRRRPTGGCVRSARGSTRTGLCAPTASSKSELLVAVALRGDASQVRHRDKNTDRLGVALLLGALIGFVIGGVVGFSSNALDAPVVLPFAGAAAGVLVTGVIAGILAFLSGRDDERRE